MQWNTSLSPFPSEQKCQKATIRAGCNWQPQQGSEEIERRGDAVPCLLWYLLLNFLQQRLQLLGHWNSFASHTHQNPHTSVWQTRLSTEIHSLFFSPSFTASEALMLDESRSTEIYSGLIICNFRCLNSCWTHDHSGLKSAMAVF